MCCTHLPEARDAFSKILGKVMPSETLAVVRAPGESSKAGASSSSAPGTVDGEELVVGEVSSDSDKDSNKEETSTYDATRRAAATRTRRKVQQESDDGDHVAGGDAEEIVIGMVGDTHSDEEVVGFVGMSDDD